MVRIVLKNRRQLSKKGLEYILDMEEDFQVVGNFLQVWDVLELLGNQDADVLIYEIGDSSLNDLETIADIKQRFPGVKVILLATELVEDFVVGAVATNADGFILNTISNKEFIEIVRLTVSGHTLIADEAADMMRKYFNKVSLDKKQILQTGLRKINIILTRRELDIAYLIAKGATNREIASQLFLSEGTVKNYISEIYQKINIKRRQEVITFFQELITCKNNTFS